MEIAERATTSVNGTSKSEPEDYDLVILGGGTGSTITAWTFASRGQRVAVIDRKYIGGSCPNIACLPSKNIIHSAKVASYFRRSAEFGVAPDRPLKIDMSTVRNRKRRMVSGVNEMYLEKYKETGGELIFGSGRFIAPRTLEVTLVDGGTRRLRGANVIISTGTRAAMEPIAGLEEAQPLTHIEALELDQVPEHLIVLGGGYIGIELAQAMRRFGSKVSIIDRNRRLLHQEDEDVSDALQALFTDEGIHIGLNMRIRKVAGRSGQSVVLTIDENGVEKTLRGTHLLVATGRAPNTEGVGLDLVGVELTDNGYIKVNERLETTAAGTWAIGEVAGSPKFTHISFDDSRVIHDSLTGGSHTTLGRQVPYCMFTDPELGHVGLSETKARTQKTAYRLFKIPLDEVLRARTLLETRGFLKALVDVESDRILGFTAFAPDAGEMLSAVQVAMSANLPYTVLRDAVLTHPTMAEGLIPLFSSVPSVCEAGKTSTEPQDAVAD